MNPNVRRAEYRCTKCGVAIPPYEFTCERHRESDMRDPKRSVLDKLMDRILGRHR